MKMLHCPNGHFYESGKYKECPYCRMAARNHKGRGKHADDTGEAEDRSVFDSETVDTDYVKLNGEVRTEVPDFSPSLSGGIGISPVVGWLVAIAGPYYGEDFRLKNGRNDIGRSSEMDIQLSMDISVSRHRHAVVIYDRTGRSFIASPGEAKQHFYVNGRAVQRDTVLKSGDVLTLGKTQLMLVALCGDHFYWK